MAVDNEKEFHALRLKVQEILEYLTDHDSMTHPMGGSIRPPSRLGCAFMRAPIEVSLEVDWDLHEKMSRVLIDKNVPPTKENMAPVFQGLLREAIVAWIDDHPEPRGSLCR